MPIEAPADPLPGRARGCLARVADRVGRLELRHLAGLFLLGLLVLVGATVAGLNLVWQSALQEQHARLEALAELKVHEAENWFKSSSVRVVALATNPVFREMLMPLRLRNAGQPVAARDVAADAQRLQVWLEHARRLNTYRSVEVLSADGLPLVALGAAPYAVKALRTKLMAVAFEPAAEFMDFQTSDDGLAYTVMAARIPDVQGLAPLWLVFSQKVEDSFLPLLSRTPNVERPVKLLIYRPENGRLTLLNQPLTSTGQFQSLAIDDLRAPETKALRAGDGPYTGLDTEGHEVLAIIRRASNVPWTFSASIRMQDMQEPLYRMAWLIGLLGLFGLLLVYSMMGLIWSTQRRSLHAARALNRRLQLSADHALDASRAKSAFLANMSHEIRTPLNAILGLTELLHARAQPASWEAVRQRQVQTAAQHLMELINAVLDMSRIESGKLQLEQIDFCIEDMLVDRVLAIAGIRAREKRLEITLDIEPALLAPLRGDPLRLGQALLNYLGNAIKFTEAGRITLTARVADEDDDGLLVRFEVHDTGIGLTEAQIARIFTSFEQGDDTMTRRFGGSGLGLAITRQIAAQMGGQVGARSKPGAGSQFWLTARLQRGVPVPPRAVHDLQGAAILIVDDQPATGQVLSAIARQVGLRPTLLKDAAQAVEDASEAAAQRAPYAVVLLDWDLPGFNGCETLHALQTPSAGTAPTVIVMTIADDLWLQEQAGLGQGLVVLPKPLTCRSLTQALAGLGTRPVAKAEDGSAPEPEPEPEPAPSAAQMLRRHAHRHHVLVVEDNPVNQIVAQELLKNLGVPSSLAADGLEGLQMATEQRYAAILMDMQMPVMDGLEATRRIRLLPGYKAVPIIAMTANAFREDREACLAAGMNDHVVKPIETEVLGAVLLKWLHPVAAPELPRISAPLES